MNFSRDRKQSTSITRVPSHRNNVPSELIVCRIVTLNTVPETQYVTNGGLSDLWYPLVGTSGVNFEVCCFELILIDQPLCPSHITVDSYYRRNNWFTFLKCGVVTTGQKRRMLSSDKISCQTELLGGPFIIRNQKIRGYRV